MSAGYRSCCCTGHLTNPGGVCCMDLNRGTYNPNPPQNPWVVPMQPIAPSPVGWSCPKCGSVYSPFTAACFRCGSETVTTSTTGSSAASEVALSPAIGKA